jgi:predicted small secreted protein
MKRNLAIAVLAAAALSLAACGDKAGNGAAAGDSTQAAGSRPAPGPQTTAAPQTEQNVPPAFPPDPPVENRDTAHHLGGGQTYASCMARARAGNPDERGLVEQTCKHLPDTPK